MDRIADRLDAAADLLSTVDRSVPGLAVSPAALGAGTAGLPGRVGHRLHAHWSAVLAARSREAADAATRVNDLATALRRTEAEYTETDESAARRLNRESR